MERLVAKALIGSGFAHTTAKLILEVGVDRAARVGVGEPCIARRAVMGAQDRSLSVMKEVAAQNDLTN